MDLIGWSLVALIVLLVAIAATTKHWRYLLIGVGIVSLAACLSACKPGNVKVVTDTRPPAQVVTKQYVPIPAKLTAPLPVPEGPLSEVIDVAKQRKATIQECNGRLEDIGKVQGTKPC